MELNLDHIEQGLHYLRIADHTLNTTYPLLHDPKMFLGVLENMHKAHEHLITATLEPLHKERLKSQSFIMQLKRFEDLLTPSQIIQTNELNVIKTVNDMLERHQKTPLEFSRKEQLVMTSTDYELHSVNAPLLQEQLQASQEMYKKLIESVASKE